MSPVAVAWGDVSTWVGSLAAVGALVAAVVAALQANRLFRIELGRDREAERERRVARERERRAQAALVAGWAKLHGGDPAEPFLPVVISRNNSDLPVFNLELTALTEEGVAIGPFVSAVVEPRTDTTPTPVGPAQDVRAALEVVSSIGVELAFTDAAGVRWHRSRTGMLEEVSAE